MKELFQQCESVGEVLMLLAAVCVPVLIVWGVFMW